MKNLKKYSIRESMVVGAYWNDIHALDYRDENLSMPKAVIKGLNSTD